MVQQDETSPTDEELAIRAGQGDQEAFEALVTRHQRRTYGLALQLLRNPQDAADAAQEAFMRCYAALHTFDKRHSFGAWLYRIAYNHCLDVLRRRQRAPRLVRSTENTEEVVESAPDPGPGVEELAERSESESVLSAALDKLTSEHRHILILRYTLDLPYGEIARILEIPESTVTMRLYHAKQALRKTLRPVGEDVDGPP